MLKIVAIGEVMIELSPSSPDSTLERKALSYAGDTYNTAITLARLGVSTSYCTRLGDDTHSRNILTKLGNEGIETDCITQVENEVPGLYMIQNTPDGEREFFYWRSASPARQLFSMYGEREHIANTLMKHDWLYLSGITLAIMAAPARDYLFKFLSTFRNKGGKVAFDSNYRPRLWDNTEAAQNAMLGAMTHTDLALLTLDDEEMLWGDHDIQSTRQRYAPLNISELVFKCGANDVIIFQGDIETRVPVAPINNVVDTTAAGDTFNAGYLSARINSHSPLQAAALASRCAGVVIQHRGGVIDKDIFLNEIAQQ
ncbi:sugar kinase [Teredinibacter purpureus]|uniref:sugar kinase n=1 Tax=Teredinibacter purpureus TaxID=2731756 RepID=UPI000695BED1|nr:sugar kinase [Teredinibacter purpureus]